MGLIHQHRRAMAVGDGHQRRQITGQSLIGRRDQHQQRHRAGLLQQLLQLLRWQGLPEPCERINRRAVERWSDSGQGTAVQQRAVQIARQQQLAWPLRSRQQASLQ